ncbi:hypothetical protein [uncultured Arthrobacter sp.]|uniref:hypothetical protein n=1 Tax=uncultured Arthrobacter sp. TaxID=114050 RepID=UPI0025DDC8B4|nr:hypothetical protein [uncultured Arthrobacter sp.]
MPSGGFVPVDGVLSDPADHSHLEGPLRLFSVHVQETVKSADLDARKSRVVSYGVITE